MCSLELRICEHSPAEWEAGLQKIRYTKFLCDSQRRTQKVVSQWSLFAAQLSSSHRSRSGGLNGGSDAVKYHKMR